jgi:hypothetical protein
MQTNTRHCCPVLHQHEPASEQGFCCFAQSVLVISVAFEQSLPGKSGGVCVHTHAHVGK